jgi:hypothetical protein
MNALNVQSFASHSSNVSTDIFALTENWMDTDETFPIGGYECISQFK